MKFATVQIRRSIYVVVTDKAHIWRIENVNENVRRFHGFTESKALIKDKENLIQTHAQYDLQREELSKKAREYVESFKELLNVDTSYDTAVA